MARGGAQCCVWNQVRTLRYHPVSDGVGGNHDLPEEEDFGQVGLQ